MAEGVDILRAMSRDRANRSDSPTGRTARWPSRDRASHSKAPTSSLDREGVLATLGYKPEKSWRPVSQVLEKSELCLRCGKKVYPVERIDVGGYYHKGCFKCKVCNIQLTLRTFHRETDIRHPTKTKEIYCKVHLPRASAKVDAESVEIRRAMNAQKHASAQMRGTGYDIEAHYDPDALEFRHASDVKKRKKVRRRSTLKSCKDFEAFGVYDAQTALEEVHREEEDQLYKQMFDDRKRHVDKLERHLADERRRTISELIKWFEERGSTKEEKEFGLRKIDNYYENHREERMALLLQRLTIEEQAAVARIIEKHSQEMLVLIEEKENEAEMAMKFAFRESQLLEGSPMVEMPEDESEESEEESEEDSEEEEDHSESFSEASYRLDMYENVAERPVGNQLVTDQRRKKPSQSHQQTEQSYENVAGSQTDRVDLKASGRHTQERKGSQRSSRHQSETKQQRHQHQTNNALDNNQHPHHIHQDLPSNVVDAVPPWHFDSGEDGEVLVRIHAAKDAHLISNHLKSTHYCFSPDGKCVGPPTFPGQSQAPKPYRPRSNRDPNNPRDSPQLGTKQQHKGQNGDKNSKNAAGNFMVFQRPGDRKKGSDDEYGEDGKGTSKSSKHKGGKNKDRSRSKRRSKENIADEAGLGRVSIKNHADRAREALRQMSLGTLENDDVFEEIQPTVPKVAPPPNKKAALYKSPDVFREFDDNAVKEAKREHKTFTELVRLLSKRCETEIHRVRAIFRWVTAKDLNKMQFSDTIDSDSPVGLLRGIKLGVESYHNLFKRLCSYAGLHCEVIDGFSKGAGYRPGGSFNGDVFRNQWTTVSVEGGWRFINCNWGARHVKRARDDRMTYKCDEFYFLTDPEEHIYQHYPDDPKWQLLPKPISLEDFIKLPVLKSPFFNNHLAFGTDYDSTIHATDGSVEVRIIAPRKVSFAAQLKSKSGHVKTEVLKDRVLVRVVNQEVLFLTNLPSPGNYYLEIYVGDSTSEDSMDNACVFKVCCYNVSSNAHVSYPPVGAFGRTPISWSYAVHEETHTDPYITYAAHLLIAWLCPSDIKLSYSLRYWNHRDRKLEEMDRYAFMTHRSDNMVSYLVHCSRRGGYVFSLMAAAKNGSNPDMKCLYRYYIECRTPSEVAHPLPKASKRWKHCRLIEPMLGELPSKTKVRFRVESHTALELVVSIDQSWFNLQKSGNLWQGVVNTGEGKGKLFLFGRFDAGKEKYSPLLEYYIKGPKSMEDEVKAMMKYL